VLPEAFRHLQLNTDFYWGEGDDIIYRLVKLDRNMMDHGAGRLVNPMMIPFAGSMASKLPSGQRTIFGGASLLDPDEISTGWIEGDKVFGVVGGKRDCSRVFAFDETCHGVVDARLYIHPKNLFVSVPSKQFSPAVITKTKWKELPTIGWRPVEAEDVSDQGPSTSRTRTNVLTKLKWFTEEFPDRVFEPKDMEAKLGQKTTLQKLFE